MSGPTYVVTGGAGFIGSNLVAALLSRTPRPHVIVVDNFRSGSFANIVEACERRGVGAFDGEVLPEWAGNLDWDSLSRRGVQAVFHLGAITDTTVSDQREMILENLGGFYGDMESHMLRACASAKVPLVYASSAATYGTPLEAYKRVPFPIGSAGKPNNVYGFSKWLMECEHRRFASGQSEEPSIVGLRYFNVFGPGEARKGKMASMVYQLAKQVIEGQRPRIFEDGAQARDQVYVDDVVECTLAGAGLAGSGKPKPGIYNLGSGVTTPFNDIVDAVRDGVGLSAKERPTDYFAMPADIRAFYQDYTCADMSETERGLGWRPRHEPRKAMREYAKWLSSGQPGERRVL